MNVQLRQVLAAGCLLLFPFFTVQACGPDFQPDVFVRVTRPDNTSTYAEGHLGILQNGYDSNELAVAYRYLNGGSLSSKEIAAYAPAQTPSQDWSKMSVEQIQAARQAEQDAQPVNQWRTARKQFLPADPAPAGLPDAPEYYSPDSVNCPNAAFQTAVLTVNRRAATWGQQSPWLADWIHAQDAVFSNCESKTPISPAAAPDKSPTLLRVDRAYQVAAALFYARKYDEARAAFEAIAQDADSPWRSWGRYLAARAMVRKAFALGHTTDEFSLDLASFDPETMQTAQQMLEKLLAAPDAGVAHGAIENELAFVRMRTEPDKRAAEICAALAGPNPDPRFKQDLDDLNFLLIKHVKLSTVPPLLEWIPAVRTGNAADALDHWRRTRTLPWLVAALMKAYPASADPAELLSASTTIHPGTPAFETIAFHRVRLLTALHRDEEARTLVDSILKANHAPDASDTNAFRGQRMALARTFDEFLEYAPRTVLDPDSAGYYATGGACANFPDPKDRPANCLQDLHPLKFDGDSVAILNRQMPLERLIEAARSPKLPQNMRDEVVLAAWTRSVLLGDKSSAAQLTPLLPDPLRRAVAGSVDFPATLAILRNPGLRPMLEPGITRFSSYSVMDHFRDNWWCADWQVQQSGQKPNQPKSPDPVTFLPRQEQVAAEQQYQHLLQLPAAPIFLGQRAIDYAKAHPSDPDAAEALALTVRATHYACLSWGNNEKDAAAANTAMSKAAFRLLHSEFPKSTWAAKTRYYY